MTIGNRGGYIPPIGDRPFPGNGAAAPSTIRRVVSSAGGGDFATIQAAIDDITDASQSKPYVVEVYPGIYTENVTGKNWVSIIGVGDPATIILRNTSGTLYTTPDTFSGINGIRFELLPTASGSICVDATAGGTHFINFCEMDITSSTNGITAQFAVADCTQFTLVDTNCDYNMFGSSAGTLSHKLIETQNTTAITMNTLVMNVYLSDVDDDLIIFGHDSTGTFILANSFIVGVALNASYTGTLIGMSITEAASVIFGAQSLYNIIGSGSGTGIALKLDTTTNNGIVDSSANRYLVAGFTNNYHASAGTGDTINASYDDISAAQSTTGAGLVNFTGTFADGQLAITGGGLFTIDTQNVWHSYSSLSVSSVSNVDSGSSKTGSITAYADAGGGQVTVTSAGHTLVNGDVISIAGTTNYNDIYTVSNVAAGTFEITETFAGDDGTGTYHMGPYLCVRERGRYSVQYNFTAAAAGSGVVFEFAAFQDETVIAGTAIKRRYATSADEGSHGGGGNFFLEKGERVWFGIRNTTNATDITISEGSFRMNKIS